jgi:hypothetical protein
MPTKKTTKQTKNSPRAAKAAAHRSKALSLRMAGQTYEQIGKALKLTTQRAYQLVSEALKELRSFTLEQADDYRALELQRLDALQQTLEAKLLSEDNTLAVVNMILKVIESRCKLLGLYTNKTEITGKDGEPLIGSRGVLVIPEELWDTPWRNIIIAANHFEGLLVHEPAKDAVKWSMQAQANQEALVADWREREAKDQERRRGGGKAS